MVYPKEEDWRPFVCSFHSFLFFLLVFLQDCTVVITKHVINSDQLPWPASKQKKVSKQHGAATSIFQYGNAVFRMMCGLVALSHSILVRGQSDLFWSSDQSVFSACWLRPFHGFWQTANRMTELPSTIASLFPILMYRTPDVHCVELQCTQRYTGYLHSDGTKVRMMSAIIGFALMQTLVYAHTEHHPQAHTFPVSTPCALVWL